MRVATLTTWNENMRVAETGDHKGRPYDGIVGGIFVAIAHVGCHRHHQS